MGLFVHKEKEPEPQTFSDLIRGLQYSVNTAQQILERHHLFLLDRYLNSDGTPASREIRLSRNKKLHFPLLALINQNSLNIDEMEIEFNARVNATALKKVLATGKTGVAESGRKEHAPENIPVERTCFDINFTPSARDGDVMKVKIKFKNNPVPEGVARLTDEFNKQIYVADADQAEN